MDELLVFKLPNSRRRALTAAREEALQMLKHLGAKIATRGPFGDPAGLFYIELPVVNRTRANALLPLLGYTNSVDRVVLGIAETPNEMSGRRWRGQPYYLESVYRVDMEEVRTRSPDRRSFVLPTKLGLRSIVGYRGDSGRLSRRGLPVVDAKLLASLTYSPNVKRFLDPFGGVGGVAIEAIARSWSTFTTDTDPIVMHGLKNLGSLHCVADARHLPFTDECFDAIASEPPYEASEIVVDALSEICRTLASSGRVALLIAAAHRDAVVDTSHSYPWELILDEPIDRKGLAVHLLCWQK